MRLCVANKFSITAVASFFVTVVGVRGLTKTMLSQIFFIHHDCVICDLLTVCHTGQG